MAANAGEHKLHGKSPFSVLLHDLTQEMDSLRKAGCTFIVGGDWNQREGAAAASGAKGAARAPKTGAGCGGEQAAASSGWRRSGDEAEAAGHSRVGERQ